MTIRTHSMRAWILVLLVAMVVSPALGCAGETTGAADDLPAGLQAVMGRTETEPATLTSSAWRVTRGGVDLKELPANYVLAVGERGSTVAYSDLDTGRLYLWHPGKPSPDDISTIESPTDGAVAGDVMALSPDEITLALVRYQEGASADAGTDDTVVSGWIIDVPSGRVNSWAELGTAGAGDEVTALRWCKTSRSIYLSVGYKGGSQGERSYRYEPSTGELLELAGLAAVMDVGLKGRVVGLGAAASPDELDYPAGSAYGLLPLVLWQDGELVRLPRHPALATWDFAWISDDGLTIVVRGSAAGESGQTSCLEVLRLGGAGWEVNRIFDGDDSLSVIYGVAFEPNSGVFYFQGGSPSTTPGGAITGNRLYALDTNTGRVSPYLGLPGGDGENFVQALGVAGTERRAGTECRAGCE